MKIAILGYGTLGQGIHDILTQRRGELEASAGRPVELERILVRDLKKDRGFAVDHLPLTDDFESILKDPSIDLVFEVTSSGSKGLDYCLRLLEAGKQVVSANKAAIASSFYLLQETAHRAGVHFRFEAAVAGGIPLIDPVSKISRLNEVSCLFGILNASTNYLLTELGAGRPSAEVLAEARGLGILEEDPLDDMAGYDARRKLAILASILLKEEIEEARIPTIGIQALAPPDFAWAREQGACLKLIASLNRQTASHSLSVLPTALPADHALAGTPGLMNRIQLVGDLTGPLSFYGPGGGKLSVAHALWTDFFEILSSKPVYHQKKDGRTEDRSFDREALFYLRKEGEAKGRLLTMTAGQALEEAHRGHVVIEKGSP